MITNPFSSRVLASLLFATLLWLPQSSSAETIQLAKTELRERIEGYWIGQLAGNYIGFPFENLYQEEPLPVFIDRYYTFRDAKESGLKMNLNDRRSYIDIMADAFGGAWSDDDSDIEFVYLHAVEKHGLDLSYTEVASFWKAHINRFIWAANARARELMDEGLEPPVTGSRQHNREWYRISSQLTTEIWGVFYPGLPAKGGAKAQWAAHITTDSWATHPDLFFGAAFSAAYVEKDIDTLVRIGRSALPKESPFAEGIDSIVEWREAGLDWKAVRSRLHAQYYKQVGDVRIPLPSAGSIINGLCAIVALLYGEGDWTKTVGLATTLGYDCDNQAATCGALLGMVHGAEGIPEKFTLNMPSRRKWEKPFNDTYINYSRDGLPAWNRISDIVDRILVIAEGAIMDAGGQKIEEEGEVAFEWDFAGNPRPAGAVSVGAFGPQPKRPNIVIVLADDMGWGDSGTYGHPLIKTPNLDKLAAQGVKFNQCYSACGVCSPSRSAILTGRTPYRNGVWRHLSGNHPAHLRTSEITYPKLLNEADYETCHVGKWHLLAKPQFNNPEYPQPGDHGYDYWFATHNNASPSHEKPDNFYRNGKSIGKTEGYSALVVATEADRWLTERRDPNKPFALSVWFHEPHSPIATDQKYKDLYDGHENATYMGNISQLDDALGKVMATLDKIGVTDNTLFFFSSDNGPVGKFGGTTGGLRGGKRSDFEGGIRVPGVARWPGHIPAGTTSDVPIIGSDLFTTILTMADVPIPNDRTIDGVNMIPAFTGKPLERPIPMFWRTHVSPPDNRVAMRIGDWKIVANDELTDFKLFEVQKDWKEENDLAAEMPEKTAEMKNALLKLWNDIEAEGPKEWWLNERQAPVKGGKLNY